MSAFVFVSPHYIDVKSYIEQNNLPIATESAEQASSSAPAPLSAPAPVVSVTSAAAASTTAPASADYEDIELSNVRKVIAKRLVFSKTTIPHSYATLNCVIDRLIEARKELIASGTKVSLNDYLIKAIALALRLVPEVNSNINETTGAYTRLATVDISIAVATDNGLITPIVKNADRLSVAAISDNVKVHIFIYKYD